MYGSDGRTQVHEVDHWFREAPPAKGAKHWKPGRSAMEAALAWCGGSEACVPRDLQRLLESHEATRSIRISTAMVERQTKLDDWGRGRQHDLLAFGTVNDKRVVVGIECKADESFGDLIGRCLEKDDAANARRTADGVEQVSKRPQRIKQLSLDCSVASPKETSTIFAISCSTGSAHL